MGEQRTWLLKLLKRAGEVALERRNRLSVTRKEDGSPVTDADLAAEEVLVEGIIKQFPHDSICGEEGASKEGEQGTWVIDPIDGTAGFISGLAYWGPTIARIVNKKVEQGGFWIPMLQEGYTAIRNEGLFLGEQPLKRRTNNGSNVLYAPSRVHKLSLPFPGKLRILGSTAAHLTMVARGAGDVALVARWSIWDVAAGCLMIEESGGAIYDLHGQPFDPVAAWLDGEGGLPMVALGSTHTAGLIDGWADVFRSRGVR